MTHVATLIADPTTPCLDAEHLRAAAAALRDPRPPRWLAPGIAAEISFACEGDGSACCEVLRDALGSAPLDIVVQAATGRRKRLLVADMDSTLIHQECVDELADAVGLRDAVAAITARAMRGEIAFEPALRARVALLRGLEISAALRIFHERVTFMPGGRALVRTMRAHGAVTAIVSGGFTLFTGLVAEALGFDAHFANTLVSAGASLSGCVEEPILGREAKARVLQRLRERHALRPQETMAVGDGANDLAMLAEAGLGVAFRAKPKVDAAARARVRHGDLTALLYIQGYSEAEFVRD